MTSYLPIYVKVSGKKILLIGGGNVALHKLAGLLQFDGAITVIARNVLDSVKQMPVTVFETEYSTELLSAQDYTLVYACTNDRDLNARICEDGRALKIPVNVVDDPELSDFISPAIFKQGPMVVAVSSSGSDVKKTVRWRDQIKDIFYDQTQG